MCACRTTEDRDVRARRLFILHVNPSVGALARSLALLGAAHEVVSEPPGYSVIASNVINFPAPQVT
jgi:hypothetical protein